MEKGDLSEGSQRQEDSINEGRAPVTDCFSLTQLCGDCTALLSTADILSGASPFGRSHQESSLFSQETVSLLATRADLHASLLQSCQLQSL